MDDLENLKRENRQLRRMLAVRIGGSGLYRDDGELQDASQHPFIDFKRDSADEIQAKLIERNQKTIADFMLLMGQA